MVQIMEDVQLRYIRNSSDSIIQWAYGEDNMDRYNSILDEKTIDVG
jgi:hypothetical protein